MIAHREGRKRGGRGEKEGRKGGRRQGVMCVKCEVGSGKILATELIRENIENSIRKK